MVDATTDRWTAVGPAIYSKERGIHVGDAMTVEHARLMSQAPAMKESLLRLYGLAQEQYTLSIIRRELDRIVKEISDE